MNKNYTHITVILDRSGSMASCRDDVVGGLNTFIDEQKKAPGKCTFTLVQFDDTDPYDVLRDFESIENVKAVGAEYKPRGNTPLFDAMAKGIIETGKRLADLPQTLRPDKVIFVTVTDGHENASRNFTAKKLAAMTKEQTDTYKWEFVYLGANQDAFAVGSSIGTQRTHTADYDTTKMKDAFYAVSLNATQYRNGDYEDMSFKDFQRTNLKKDAK